jgi:hypothetical protein
LLNGLNLSQEVSMVENKQFRFMCIGAQKSGTTWLYHQLKRHPSVAMPPLKEIHYFDELQRNVPTAGSDRLFNSHWMNKRWRLINTYLLKKILKINVKETKWFFNYLYKKRNYEWYENLFKLEDGKISGDITPDYAALSPELVSNIHARFPELKIIFLMRNPIERKWSQIKMVLGEKQNRDFKTVPCEEYLHACENWNDELCEYSKTINTWKSAFGEENLFTGFYDELENTPVDLYIRILKFLNIEEIYDESKLRQVVYGGNKTKMPDDAYSILSKQMEPEIMELIATFPQVKNYWVNN